MNETSSNDESTGTAKPVGRAKLIYRVLLFQLKLAADGLRDLLLVPISLFAGLFGLIAGGKDPERYFRELLRFGRRTDRFINLFNQFGNQPEDEQQETLTSDELLAPYQEKFVDHASRSPLVQSLEKRLENTESPPND